MYGYNAHAREAPNVTGKGSFSPWQTGCTWVAIGADRGDVGTLQPLRIFLVQNGMLPQRDACPWEFPSTCDQRGHIVVHVLYHARGHC